MKWKKVEQSTFPKKILFFFQENSREGYYHLAANNFFQSILQYWQWTGKLIIAEFQWFLPPNL